MQLRRKGVDPLSQKHSRKFFDNLKDPEVNRWLRNLRRGTILLMLFALGPFVQFFATATTTEEMTTVTTWSHITEPYIIVPRSRWIGSSVVWGTSARHITENEIVTLWGGDIVKYVDLYTIPITLTASEMFTVTNVTTRHGPDTFTIVRTIERTRSIYSNEITSLSSSMTLMHFTWWYASENCTSHVNTVYHSNYILTTQTLPRYNFGRDLTTVFSGSDNVGFMATTNIFDDSGMLGIYAHRSPPRILFPKTDTGKVLPTGEPTWSGYTHLVTVGGRAANPTTKYYEDNGLAPLKWAGNSTHAIIMRGTEAKLNVPLSSLGPANDYSVMQVVTDGSHKVITLWGITQYGTYASGVYFDGKFTDMASLTAGWYIIRWQDSNSNGIPDYPAEFTIVASGT